MSRISKSHTMLRGSTLTGTAALISNIDHMTCNKEEAINKAKYGFTAIKHGRSGRPHKRVFYISEYDSFALQWISHRKSYIESRIILTEIRQIE